MGLLIPIRRAFRQFVNLRPIKVFPGVASPLRGVEAGDVGFVVVRENVEGEYSEIGGRLNRGFPDVTSATKSNGIVHTLPFWDEVVAERARAFPDVRWDQEHIDALAAKLVLQPGRFDVIVGSNLFGDILSDLAAAVAGSIGIAPSANLDPTRTYPSMFEPVHGSAPDIAGQGVANPVGAIWSAAMMLDHLGHPEPAADVLRAMEATPADPATRTRDLGGTADTATVVDATIEAMI